MGRWALDDIPWDRFDRAQLDPEIVSLVKAAASSNTTARAYARHLCRVFADDPAFQASARRWGAEEVQHGEALGALGRAGRPEFDFAAAFARFRAGYRIDFDCRPVAPRLAAGEMIARCIVETGTSSYYTALKDAAAEPVLQRDLPPHRRRRVAPLQAVLQEPRRVISSASGSAAGRRLRVALGRARRKRGRRARLRLLRRQCERPTAYDRRHHGRAYARRAFAVYRKPHVVRGPKTDLQDRRPYPQYPPVACRRSPRLGSNALPQRSFPPPFCRRRR